jgi:hypothetical protein
MAGEDDNDDVIVSLPADTSTVLVTKVETEKAKPAPVEDDPVADLKNQFSAMQRQNEVLQNQHQTVTRQLNETQTRLHHVEGEVVTSQLDTVLSGIAAADAEAASAEQALAIAIEAGDAMAQARANRAMAAAEGRKARLEEAKSDLEEVAKRRPAARAETREAPQRRAPADPIDQFTQNMSSRSAAWIRAHPDCVTDTKKHARMLAAHNLAIAEDVEVDSDEYFKRIEAGIRPVKTETTENPKKGDGTRPSSAAASAAGAGGGLNGGVQVKLTKGEAASATDGTLVWNYDDPTGQKRFKKGEPIGLAEMARRKHEGMKNGLYDRNSFEA